MIKYWCCIHCGHYWNGRLEKFLQNKPWHSKSCWIEDCEGVVPNNVNLY